MRANEETIKGYYSGIIQGLTRASELNSQIYDPVYPYIGIFIEELNDLSKLN
jgi:hypothetical protein